MYIIKIMGFGFFWKPFSLLTHTYTHMIHRRNLLTLGAFVFISEEGSLISSNHILGLAKISYCESGSGLSIIVFNMTKNVCSLISTTCSMSVA